MQLTSSANFLLGFIVSGHHGERASPGAQSLKPVMARSKDEALELVAVMQHDGDFHATGILGEVELREQLASLALLNQNHPEPTLTGFIVGGNQTTDKNRGVQMMISVCAQSMDEALGKVSEANPDFIATGCLSETQAKVLLNMIDKVRKPLNSE